MKLFHMAVPIVITLADKRARGTTKNSMVVFSVFRRRLFGFGQSATGPQTAFENSFGHTFDDWSYGRVHSISRIRISLRSTRRVGRRLGC